MSIEQMTTSERLRRLLAALDDLDLRGRRAAEFLGDVPAEEAVRALDELLRSAQRRPRRAAGAHPRAGLVRPAATGRAAARGGGRSGSAFRPGALLEERGPQGVR